MDQPDRHTLFTPTDRLSLQAKRQRASKRHDDWVAAGKPGLDPAPAFRVDDMPDTGTLRERAEAHAKSSLLNPIPPGAVVRSDEGNVNKEIAEGVRLNMAQALVKKADGADAAQAERIANAVHSLIGPMITRADDTKPDADLKNKVLEKTGAELGPPKSPGARKDEETEEEGKTRKAADEGDNPMSAVLDALGKISSRLDALEKGKEEDRDDSGSEDVPDRRPGGNGALRGSDSDDPYATFDRQRLKISMAKDKEGRVAFDSTTDHLFFKYQARADRVYAMQGSQAPKPMHGETRDNYRRRLLTPLQPLSDQYRNIDLRVAQVDPVNFDIAEDAIYKHAEDSIKDPRTVKVGHLRELTETRGGHTFTTFVGTPKSWMSAFAPPGRRVRKIIQRSDSGHETTLYQR
jgi:hypothetical protein